MKRKKAAADELKRLAAAFRDLRERIRAHNRGKPRLKIKDLINEGRIY